MGIRDRLALPDAEAWRPAVGDEVVGRVIGVETRGTEEYGDYPCIVVQEYGEDDQLTDSLVAIHCFHSVLKNEVAKLAPEAGDEIAVQFRGEKVAQGGKGKPYANYKLVIEKGDGTVPAVDWAKHQAAAQTELAAVDEEPF